MSGGVDSSTVAALLAREGRTRRRADHAAVEPAPAARTGRSRARPGAAARSTTSTTRAASPSRSASPITSSTSRSSSKSRWSSRSSTSTSPAARRSPARSATTTSSSTSSWRWPTRVGARARSPPATTRASATTRRPAATSCCAASTIRQGPDLFPVRADAGAARAHAVSARRDDTSPRCARWRGRWTLAVAAKGRQPGDLLRSERRLRRVHERLSPETGRARGADARRDRDADGRALGEHGGVHHFTVGQRKGLGIRRRRAALRHRDGARRPSA